MASVSYFHTVINTLGRMNAQGNKLLNYGNYATSRPLRRPRRRWEDNIKMDLQEVECGDMDWIALGGDRHRCRALVNAVMDLRVP